MIGSSQCDAQPAESEIHNVTRRLGSAIHELDSAIAGISDQLGYVLKDECDSTGECAARLSAGNGYLSPLARDLQCCIEAINGLTARANETKSRLAL